MNILLISGHGNGDPGAVATIDGKVYREADETRYVTAALKEALFGAADVDVYPVDRNAYKDHKAGCLQGFAKFSRYDYVLEIHFNAIGASGADGRTKGTEIYVTRQEARTAVEQAIVDNLAALGLRNRGVKRSNFSVIYAAANAGVSSALLEVCFLDDPDDMAVYTGNRAAAVEAIAAGIREGFGLEADKVAAAKAVLREKAGLAESTIQYLAAYKWGDELLVKLAGAMK